MKRTTILCVRHKGGVVLAGDGQVTLGATVMKHTAKKVRKLYQNKCLAGFLRGHGGRVHAPREV